MKRILQVCFVMMILLSAACSREEKEANDRYVVPEDTMQVLPVKKDLPFKVKPLTEEDGVGGRCQFDRFLCQILVGRRKIAWLFAGRGYVFCFSSGCFLCIGLTC